MTEETQQGIIIAVFLLVIFIAGLVFIAKAIK